MERYIYKELLKWKSNTDKKPLLLRGARQVGKTYIIRELGKSFGYYLEVNFESEPEVKKFFKDNLSPDGICNKLSAYYNIPVVDGQTLLFMDEIQSCPEALQSLRFFYEKRKKLHVVAAGSLLEFALQELASFGVGRIRSIFMYPMSFNEFLTAIGKKPLIELKQSASFDSPMDEVFHRQLTEYFLQFLVVGGMPEAVKCFSNTHDLLKVQQVLDDILISLEDDFSKYRDRVSTSRLKEVYLSVIHQTGNLFNLTKSCETGNFGQKKEALTMLEMAGLCYKVYHSSANGLPLAAEMNPKKFKVIFFDTGLFQRSMKASLADFQIVREFEMINKGFIVEQYVGLELIKNNFSHAKPELYYWHREKKGSSAEVDYLIESKGNVLPIEVKSGYRGKMQSLFLFLELKNQPFGIRISLENFSQYDKIMVCPVYSVDRLC